MKKSKILLSLSLVGLNILNAMQEKEIKSNIDIMQTTLAKFVLEKKSIKEEYVSINNIISPMFDFTLMGKLVLGKKEWNKATNSEKDKYIVNFTENIKSFYIDKFDLYTGQKLLLKEPVKTRKRITVTNLIIGKSDTNEVKYKLYKNKKRGWVIYDVEISGVSVIKIFRAQYKDILKKTDINGLIIQLNKK